MPSDTATSPSTSLKWTGSPGKSPASYADKDVQGIAGKIVELGDLDDVVAHIIAESGVTNSDTSQQIDVTLDDIDGSIKEIFDSYDVHKRSVRVYQWFESLDLSDKFLVFAGKINTPVSWNERDRTVKITVVSQLEDQEIGFSAEEGQFPYLPADLVGKAWPMLFGTVIDSPALQINKALEACTLAGVGIVSGAAQMSGLPLYENGTNSDGGGNAGGNALTVIQMDIILEAAECWMGVDDQKSQQLTDQYNKMAEKFNEQLAQKAAQEACARMKRRSRSPTPPPRAPVPIQFPPSAARIFHRTRRSRSTLTAACSRALSSATTFTSPPAFIPRTTWRPNRRPAIRPTLARRRPRRLRTTTTRWTYPAAVVTSSTSVSCAAKVGSLQPPAAPAGRPAVRP